MERGSHTELLAANGAYADLWNQQQVVDVGVVEQEIEDVEEDLDDGQR